MVRLNGYGEAAVRWGPAFTSDSQWLRPENRFVLAADGVLVDQSNQRQWQKADNSFSNLEAFRGDLTWNDARSYCEAKGPAWRLPTVDELRGLYEESGTLTTSCGSSDCKVSPLFQLSKNQFWSGSTASPGTAYRVVLVNGQRAAVSTDDSVGKRALCVRDAYP